ncbi:MAG TPA: LysR family transcriptional regulator [Caulobacteraceae bacterium]|nr:LysR family transcriptional regulator [Caulobacteraceae bacterium]
MPDLNDLSLFAAVVRHGGFAPAARALGAPKSKLSKHVARLEQRLGVRLIERSSRKFRVTDTGQAFREQVEAALAQVEAAEAIVAQAQAEPRGLVRASCPPGLTQHIMAGVLPGFLTAHPKVKVQLLVVGRRVDLIAERIDVALRVRERLDTDPDLTMRTLGASRLVLAASPSFVAGLGHLITIETLGTLPTLTFSERIERDTWRLTGPDGKTAEIEHGPRLSTGDFDVLVGAAVAGLGVALIPDHYGNDHFRAGRLVQLLPDWSTSEGIVHAVYTGRHGQLPAVRAFIDHLAREFPAALRQCQEYAAEARE